MLSACRMQLAESRRQPAHLLILVTNPLFGAMFLAITTNAGDPVAVTYAVFAPALLSLWFLSLDLGGAMVSRERWNQTLDQLIATPARLGLVIFGRILAVVLLAGVTFVEAYLVARFGFGVRVKVEHGWLLALAIAVTLVAMAGTATALAGLFVLSRRVLLFQNAMTYPFYLLGGVLVPITLLPGWLHPVARLFFLSWSSDLVRASLRPDLAPRWWVGVIAVLVLGVGALVGGVAMVERVVDRVRANGSATFA